MSAPDNPNWGSWDQEDADGVGWNEDGSPNIRPTWTPRNTYA